MAQEIPYQTAGFRDEENNRFVLINPIYIGTLDSAEGSGDFVTGDQYFNLSGVSQLNAGSSKSFISVDDDLDSSITGASGYVFGGTNSGYRMPFSGSVRNISLQLNTITATGNTTVTLYKNGSSTSATMTIDCTSTGSRGNHTAITPESFAKGDYLSLAITHSVGTLKTSDHNGLIYIYYNESS